MTEDNTTISVRRMYGLTSVYGVIGFLCYLALQGLRPAIGFALGAAGSLGNLWVFERLSAGLAPGKERKPWQAGAYVTRYLILFGGGYVIVKSLGVNPLPVILGLLASTAAVLTSLIIELVISLFRSRVTH
ncbi:MAG: ATP synthase subunit I [Acidobacteriaceae bacterium]|nr:ATP synthase subunit I [Acidobacteriaceae bacterium]MBV9502515.1 ATP synthase subunit I [Acidobacteriaceae bacterium]